MLDRRLLRSSHDGPAVLPDHLGEKGLPAQGQVVLVLRPPRPDRQRNRPPGPAGFGRVAQNHAWSPSKGRDGSMLLSSPSQSGFDQDPAGSVAVTTKLPVCGVDNKLIPGPPDGPRRSLEQLGAEWLEVGDQDSEHVRLMAAQAAGHDVGRVGAGRRQAVRGALQPRDRRILEQQGPFAQAGITAPPKTLDELYSAIDKLKAAGTTPIALGSKDKCCRSDHFHHFSDPSVVLQRPRCGATPRAPPPGPRDDPDRLGPEPVRAGTGLFLLAQRRIVGGLTGSPKG